MRKLAVLFYIFVTMQIFSHSFSEYYKNGVVKEKAGRIAEAIAEYRQAIVESPSSTMSHRIALKIARISPTLDSKLKEYDNFIANYPKSKLILLAYYEKGTLLHLARQYTNALITYNRLMEISYGTPYFIRAALFSANIYLQERQFDMAISSAFLILESTESEDDLSEAYFLLGQANEAKGKFDDAMEFYTISVGAFPQALIAPRALLQLLRRAVSLNESDSIGKFATLFEKNYSGTFEYIEAKRLLGDRNPSASNATFSDLFLWTDDKKNPVNKSEYLKEIVEQIRASLEISDVFAGDAYFVKPGVYLQLASYSSEENAKSQIATFKAKGVVNLLVYRQVTTSGYLYKIISGSYQDRKEANVALIDLKDKGIHAFPIEISPNYE